MCPCDMRAAANKTRVALACTVGVVTLLAFVLGAVYGPTAYHVLRLNQDPLYLRQIIVASQGTARWRALENFLGEESGKKRLLELYLAEGIERVLSEHSNLSMGELLKGVVWSQDEELSFVVEAPNGEYWASGGKLDGSERDNRSRWLAVNRFLSELKDEWITLDKYPGMRFTLCTLDYDRLVETGIPLSAANWPAKRIPLACFFEKAHDHP
jgi:hypothetical protein